jgi:Domain of unknown function (DUF6471)
MPTEAELAERLKRFLKAELKRADITYEELAARLTTHGVPETKASIASKLGRGTFAATFLIAALMVLGLEGISLDDV